MSQYRFAESENMTSKEIDAKYNEAVARKLEISIEMSKIKPDDEKAIAAKRKIELAWERKCIRLSEDFDRKRKKKKL